MSSIIPSRNPEIPPRFNAALERLDGSVELLRGMAEIFVEDLPPVMSEFDAMLGQHDQLPLLARIAHKLKGMVVTFDNEVAGPLLEEMVGAARREDVEQVQILAPQVHAEVNQLYRHVVRLTKV